MNARLAWFGAIALFAALVSPLGNAARADVVYGNLGNTGGGNLGSTVNDFGNNPPITDFTQRFAQGFTTGTSPNFLTLQSVTLGLFAATPPASEISMTVGIHTNVGGKPAASASFTSSAVSIGDTGKYAFTFANSVLAPSTSYWIVPVTPSTGSWVENATSSQPIGRNGSGYNYLGTLRYGQFDEEDQAIDWYSAANKSGMSVSITAVPEPSTYAMAATALSLAGIAAARRRRAGR
jgi:hypothetical protein